MTNVEIVMANQMALIAEGKIGEDENIHTYQKWKQLGYQVKKGEHAITSFPVWKPAKKKEQKDGEEIVKPYMFMKNAAFFSSTQVEAII